MVNGKHLLATVLLLIALLAAPVAHAHGGGTPRLVRERSGPYDLYAWTSPDPARVGPMHVTVALAEPESERPVLDANVQLALTPVEVAGSPSNPRSQATREEAANKTTYEADLELPAPGQWQVTISIEGPDGSGRASFDLDVQPRSRSNWLLLGGAGLVVIALTWLLRPETVGRNASLDT